MKSQAKVKQQRRIKSIPPFCDNPISGDLKYLQPLRPNKVSKHRNTKYTAPKNRARRMNRTSK
jgi:hypothetical protein